jgi:hypothetical protein
VRADLAAQRSVMSLHEPRGQRRPGVAGCHPGNSAWASSLPDNHLKAFAGELREAVVAESPERVKRVLFDWQMVAEVRAGARST